jgi:hypothetical protein
MAYRANQYQSSAGDTPMMGETIVRLADTGTRVPDVEALRLRPDSQLDSRPGSCEVARRGRLQPARDR